jgi:N-acyl-D-amino-acid deacylase
LKKYDGMFLSEIARIRRQKTEDALIDIARESGGRAAVLCHRYSTEAIVHALIRHPLSLFMTDAWVDSGAQNPSAYGAFPRFLKLAREKRLLSLEEAVHKMTGAAADRFGLAGRGILAEGAAADVTVFDPQTVEDGESAGTPPAGIEHVFINGKKVMSGGKKDPPFNSGMPL